MDKDSTILTIRQMIRDNERISFDSETHTYSIDGVDLNLSVTEILRLAGITSSFEFVSDEVLQKAVDRGNAVHKEIENFIREGKPGFTEEFRYFIDLIYPKCEKWFSEVTVYRNGIAGRIDLIGVMSSGAIMIVDIKSGTSTAKDQVSAQTSFYRWLTDKYLHNIPYYLFLYKALPFYGDCKFVELEKKSDEYIQGIIDTVNSGDVVAPKTSSLSLTHQEMILRFLRAEAEYKALKTQMDAQKEELASLMEKNGIKTLEGGGVKVTLRKSSVRQVPDLDAFKESAPASYREYCKYKKDSIVKASVTIKLEDV